MSRPFQLNNDEYARGAIVVLVLSFTHPRLGVRVGQTQTHEPGSRNGVDDGPEGQGGVDATSQTTDGLTCVADASRDELPPVTVDAKMEP